MVSVLTQLPKFCRDEGKEVLRRPSACAPGVQDDMFPLSALLAFLLLITAIAPSPVFADDNNKISFIPLWVPQAQFAGYYVALEKGFFADRGLDVDILEGGPALPPAQALRTGQARCGVMFLANGVVERAKGLPIVNIAQIVQRSAQLLVARASSGINSPKDMEGKKVGLWGAEFQVQAHALFRKFGVNIQPIPQTTSVNLFLRGGVDVASAMWHNEYHTLINSGLEPDELRIFFFDEFGLTFPEDGIYCLEDFAETQRKQTCDFRQAILEGWDYAFAHPSEAIDIVMKRVEKGNAGTNRVHQKWMLERMQDLMKVPRRRSPHFQEEAYARVTSELLSSGLIESTPSYAGFYFDCGGTP